MSPKLPLLLRDLPLPLTHGFFCLHPSPYSKRHLNPLSATGLTVVTNRQTDRHTDRPRNVGNNSPHLMLCTAMRAKKKLRLETSDGNSPVSQRQQITFRATLIFHLIDGLLSTTAAHEVRRAGVLTCGFCRLERSARPHPHRG